MAHPLFEQLANSSFENMTDNQPAPTAHNPRDPFAQTADAFANPDQGLGKGTEGPQQSQTVTSFSAHMKPWSDEAKPRARGRK